jgi:xylulose-5-phosphate/fructose-6-phosphate phosphoketolase
MNDLDRYHLVLDVVARVPGLASSPSGKELAAYCREMRRRHSAYVREHGDDMPEIRDWRWS